MESPETKKAQATLAIAAERRLRHVDVTCHSIHQHRWVCPRERWNRLVTFPTTSAKRRGRIPCPLTRRRTVAENFRCPVYCPHRSVCPGSFLHPLLHALDPAADSSCAA